MPDHAHVDSTISRRSANTMGSSAYFRKGCRGGFRHMWFVTDQRVGLERHAAPRKLAVASTIATRLVVTIARSRVHLGTHSRSEVGCGAVLPCDLAGADRSLARRTPARPRTAVPLAANISRDWSGTAAPAALRTPSLDARVGHCRHHGRAPPSQQLAAGAEQGAGGCGDEHRKPEVVLERRAAKVPERRRVQRPHGRGEPVGWQEARPPWHADGACDIRGRGAAARDEAGDDDDPAAALLELRSCPPQTPSAFLRVQQALGQPPQATLANRVRCVVTGKGANGRGDHNQPDVQVALCGEDGGRDHHRLAWQHRQHRIACAHRREQHIRPRRAGDGVCD